MRILCDVHIPYRLVRHLRTKGVDATHVNRILAGYHTKDADIARYADETESILITKDGDCRDSHLLRGKPARLLRVTLGNLSNTELVEFIASHWNELERLFEDSPRCIELGRNGLRVLPRPEPPADPRR
jgi:predicted nuclease of predicted toxin-antitoxin system